MRMNVRISTFAVSIIVAIFFNASPTFAIEDAASPAAIFEALALNGDLPTPEKPKYLSPTDMVPSVDGKLLFIAQQTAKRIDVVDLATKAVVGRIRLPNEVTGIALSHDGVTLYATCSSDLWPAGQLCVIDAGTGIFFARIRVGSGARAPVVTPDGKKLFVCNRFDNDLSVVDLPNRKEVGRIKMEREPYCAAITPDGKTLVVGNLLSGDLSIDTVTVSSKIVLVDVAMDVVTAAIRLRRGGGNVQGVVVSPDGKFAFATHLIGKFNLLGTTVEKGWLHTNNLAVIDLNTKTLVNDVCLDLSLMGMGNPWGVKCSEDGKFMVVTHAGSNDLSIISLPEFVDTVVARSARKEDMQKDFSSMLTSRKRVQVKTKGPRALAIVGNSVFTAGYFDDTAATMEEYEVSLSTTRPLATYVIGKPQLWTGALKGECFFYDASLCFQEWQSCHSCHTFGRADGKNWVLSGGAVVAPKNTQSLVNALWSPKAMWRGNWSSESVVASAIELKLFRTPLPEMTLPIDTFLMNMKPAASPYRVKGMLSSAAVRGREIYYDTNRVNCGKCHIRPLFTDNKLWNAGVPDPYDANVTWATPPLIESWRTAPYGHLGSMGFREMVELPGHTNAKQRLTAQEIDELTAYVLSL